MAMYVDGAADDTYWYGWNAVPYTHGYYPAIPMVEFPISSTSATTKKRSSNKFILAEVLAERTFCFVKKHARLGCAIVQFESEALQSTVLELLKYRGEDEDTILQIGSRVVSVRQHFDDSKREVDRAGIFVHWGHKAEKSEPLSVAVVADYFELLAHEAKVSLETGLQPPRADEVPWSESISRA
eukprot:TRINITY_DN34034_c0_g1_i1.p1 TRINITY_DN34034_c0_g1~~TRINITY_DN34034_c0_g1_i1.p1  ORF type:complete len:184 (+),score=31.32 TRINITY_DN34034_c0_g1_i1:110-661(+)